MSLKKGLISVIVPIYNAEKTIAKCVNSIQQSTYDNIEIILIDDGSTDASLDIIKDLSQKDKRIKIFSKDNSGAGLSREYGMNQAEGEYIGFVDADDYIDKDMYEILYNRVIKDKLDVCFCGNYEIKENGDITENNIRFINEEYEGNQINSELLRNTVWFPPANSSANHLFSLWKGLYAKRIIDRNDIHFHSERQVGAEDGIFNFQFLYNAQKVGFVRKCLYYYGIFGDSLTHDDSRWDSKRYIRNNNWYKTILEYAQAKDLIKNVKPYLDSEYLGLIKKSVNNIIRAQEKDCVQSYKKVKKNYVYLNKIKIWKTKGNGIKNKIDLVLCFYCFKLYKRKLIKKEKKVDKG